MFARISLNKYFWLIVAVWTDTFWQDPQMKLTHERAPRDWVCVSLQAEWETWIHDWEWQEIDSLRDNHAEGCWSSGEWRLQSIGYWSIPPFHFSFLPPFIFLPCLPSFLRLSSLLSTRRYRRSRVSIGWPVDSVTSTDWIVEGFQKSRRL